jgi:hypothetical protein
MMSGSRPTNAPVLVVWLSGMVQIEDWTLGGTNADDPDDSDFYIGTTAQGDSLLFLRNEGDLGIGTAVPAGRLHVKGDIVVGGGSSDYTEDTEYIGLRGRYTNWYLVNHGNTPFGTGLSIETAPIPMEPMFHIQADGKVGIGTYTPTERLDVDGDVHISGTLHADAGIEWTPKTGYLSIPVEPPRYPLPRLTRTTSLTSYSLTMSDAKQQIMLISMG